MWVAVAAVSSAFLAAGVPVAAWILSSGLQADEGVRIGLLAMLGPLWITIAHLLCSTFYVGFRRLGFRRAPTAAGSRRTPTRSTPIASGWRGRARRKSSRR